MDPLTAIGAVASIAQLAQTALSLSKTLYSLGTAIASASDDIQILADDLKTFSQSLTLLSRLLEDSKAWYSDDIYLLTAKVIKDCAELYVKIDKILEKLGANGKSTWKLRVKFVYKEGQIRKLMKRLRDMKGTLATILMSLQVDLQLSLLNISSASKIQRSQNIDLQPETVQVLQDAQKAVAKGGFLPKYTAMSPQTATNFPEKNLNSSSIHVKTTQRPHIMQSPSQIEMADFNAQFQQAINQQLTDTFNISQSFVVMPSQLHQQEAIASKRVSSRSVRSTSSTESFKSAISVQEEELELARKIKAVQSVMHSFTTSLEALENFIERRIRDRKTEVYAAAIYLQECLVNGGREFDQKHVAHFKQHGQVYLQFLNAKDTFSTFQSLSSRMSYEVVLGLHELSPEYLEVHQSHLNFLTDKTQHNCTLILQSLETCATTFQLELETTTSSISLPACSSVDNKISENITQQNTETVNSAPELSLPFIGYTFKRFDDCGRDDTVVQSLPERHKLLPVMSDPVQRANMELNYVFNSHFKVNIRDKPIVEQDAEAEAALASVSNTLRSAQVSVSGRKAGTLRGRRDVRNTPYQGQFSSPESEPLQEYQKQLLFNENLQPPSPSISEQDGLEQYEIQLRLLQQQNKPRLMMARQAQDSQNQAPQEDEYYYRRDIRERSRSHSPFYKKHLAEGDLRGAGAAVVANHRGRNVAGGAALGAVGAELITRARSRYREREDLSRSRSRSRSRQKAKARLGLAAACLAAADAATYVNNREANQEALGRERSRTRSVSGRRSLSIGSSHTGGVRKRSWSTSGQNETDDVNTRTPAFEEANETGFSSKRSRRRPLGRSASISDDPSARVEDANSIMSPSMNTALHPSVTKEYIPPKTEEEKAAHSKALQDYQMSLMMLDCRQNKNRRQMVRINEQSQSNIAQNAAAQAEAVQVAPILKSHHVDTISQDKSVGYSSQFNPDTGMVEYSTPSAANMDVLQDFDFDSFLQQDSKDNFVFADSSPDFRFSSGPSYYPSKTPPPMDPVQTSPHQPGEVNEPSLFVNPKQFARICKRRKERQELEERLKAKRGTRKPYLHESRHGQLRRRPRGPTGRFLTADEIAAQELEKKGDVAMKDNDSQVDKGEPSSSMTQSTSPSGTVLTDNPISPESTGYKLFMPTQPSQASTFKLFMPSSSFGQSLGELPIRQHPSSATDNLLGDKEPENGHVADAYLIKSTTSPASDFDKLFHESLSDHTRKVSLESAQTPTKPADNKESFSSTGEKLVTDLSSTSLVDIMVEDQGEMANPMPNLKSNLKSMQALSHNHQMNASTSVSAPNSDKTQAHLLLALAQSGRLWWQAYTVLASEPSSDPKSTPSAFAILSENLYANLPITPPMVSDTIICSQISLKILEIETLLAAQETQLHNEEEKEIFGIRGDVLRIVKTIQQQLGLEIATLGWSCCISLLSMLQKSDSKDLKLHKHLLQITSLIARYSVMENLYLSSPMLTLNPEYRSKLLHLCTTILRFFALSFSFFQNDTSHQIEAVMTEITLLDEGCRGFRVLCSADDAGADEDAEMGDVEDVTETDESESDSDGSWEAIEREESWA